MVTIKINDVKPCYDICETIPAKEYIESLLSPPAVYKPMKDKKDSRGFPLWELVQENKRSVEAASGKDIKVINTTPIHSFVSGALTAYKSHYTFVISPDAFWITITQGLANHITLNAEALRNKFVEHEGQALIKVQRDQFIRGSADNQWEGVFTEFSDKIKEHIGEGTHSSIVADFSTTGIVERAASEVVLMDAMKSYFKYQVRTMCGIPEFNIEGNIEDWKLIKARISGWSDYGLGKWVGSLNTILDEIVATFKGIINTDFWKSFFKEDSMSGGPFIGGWVNWLFPYIEYDKGLVENKQIGTNSRGYSGLTTSSYPASLCKTPFEWVFPDTKFNYEFIAGISGVAQLDDLSIKPIVGWAVAESLK